MTSKKNDLSVKSADILNKPYARRLVPDESGGYVATIHEFPGCVAQGDTADEALQNLENSAAKWVEAALSTGYEIRDPVSFLGHSGKIALRIPRGLHKQAAELAELEECSINQLLVSAVAEYVGGRRAFMKLPETVCLEMRKIVEEGLVSLYRNGPTSFVISFPVVGVAQDIRGTTIESRINEITIPLSGPSTTTPNQLLLK